MEQRSILNFIASSVTDSGGEADEEGNVPKVPVKAEDVDTELLRGLVRWKLDKEPEFRNQGWIMDNFPTTKKRAEFMVDIPEVAEGEEPPEDDEPKPIVLFDKYRPSKVI